MTTIDHGPVERQYRALIKGLARGINDVLNPGWDSGQPIRHGFVLLLFETEKEGRMNYVGNCRRADILTALKELIGRWEAEPPPEEDL